LRAMDITACGQTVAAGDVGVLQADLLGCFIGVDLSNGATLQMNGHSISAGTTGILCEQSKCTVTGPGDIFQNTVGIRTWGRRVGLQNLNLHDNAERALDCNAPSLVVASNLSVTHNGFGSSTKPDYTFALIGDSLRAEGLTVSDNAGIGIYFGKFKIANATVTNNGNIGANALTRALLVNTTMTGNHGLDADYDIVSGKRPRLLSSTCGKSATAYGPFPPPSWGVCAND
jgi:hypothetical protein